MTLDSVHGVRTALSSAMTDAVRAKLIIANPVRGSRGPGKGATKELPRWTRAQVKHFFDARKNEPDLALWMTALTLGLRRGELLALYWTDIDWDAPSISVQRQLIAVDKVMIPGRSRAKVVGWAEADLKSKASRRTLRMTQTLAALLQERHSHSAGRTVVFGTTENTPMHPDAVGRRWHRAVTAAGGLPAIKSHGTRHTCASLLLAMSGGNLHLVKTVMGHGSISVTVDQYGGWATEAAEAVTGPMEALLSG